MNSLRTESATAIAGNCADLDLLRRIGIALAGRHRSAWRVIRPTAHNGVVTMRGVVPTCRDRHLVVTVTRHIAGVFHVEDKLTVDDLAARSE